MTRRFTRRYGLTQIGRGGTPPPPAGPTILTVSQSAGKAAGGDVVHITGTNLNGATTALGTITNNTGVALDITTSAHAAGVLAWVITTGAGNSPSQNFTYLAAPVVASVSPSHGPATVSNTSRIVTCSGLPPVGSGVTLTATVGGNAVTSIVNNGDGTFTCTIPTHAAGATNVIVTVDGVTSTGGTGLYTFDAVPTITSFTYTSAAGGNTYGIGTGFLSGMAISVNINGTPTSLTNVVVTNGGTQVAATLPTPGPYTAGNWNVTVTNTDTQTATLNSGFTVFSPSAIAGLLWDFDANAGVTSSGGLVTNWTDQSSNAYALSASGSNRPTLTASALGTYPSIDGDGTAAWMLSTGNITQSTKSVTVFMVMKVPASNNASVIFEQTNNSKSTNVHGYRAEYNINGPQLDVSCGSTNGSTLNETYAITGSALNAGYQVFCFVYDRAAAYPITIIGGVPVYEQTNIGAALAGQGLITDGSSASNFDTAALSFFARNVSAAASSPSKASIVRAFAYNTALSQSTRQNVAAALASQYGTDLSPSTAQLMVVGDSISSVYDTAGSLSFSTFIYASQFYDNLQLDISAVSGWTASNAYTNRVATLTPRRSDIPCDLFYWLGTNDMTDTATPGDIWNNYISAYLNYANGLSSPAFRNKVVATPLPRGAPVSGTGASFEAKRAGLKTDGTAVAAWAGTTSYSSVTPSWILVTDGSGHPTVFRCTTSGVSLVSQPSWNFTVGATTTETAGPVWTCYGRPLRDYILDATNQSTYGYSVLDMGDPATPLGTYTNTSSTTYYLADTIHPQATYQTGQTAPTAPSGPPFANSILANLVPLLKQGGTFTRTYLPPTVTAVTGLATGNTNVAKGAPFSLSGRDFGELDATHPMQVIDGSSTAFDCTVVTRVSDIKLTAVAPASIAVGGPYAVKYTRTDGQTATGGSLIIIPQPSITGVTVGSLPVLAAETLPHIILNPFTVNISVNNGGGYGATAATFNGVSLTGVTYSADGATVTGTLPVGTYTAGTGSVTVTSPSTPTALSNGAIFATAVDPPTNNGANTSGFGDGSTIQGSGTATGWNDTTANANNLTATASPTINSASSVFQQNGTGVKTVTLDGATQLFSKTGFVVNTVDATPIYMGLICKLASVSVSNVGIFYYPGAGGTFQINSTNTTYHPSAQPSPVQATWATSIQNLACLIMAHANGATVSTAGLSINGATEVTASGTMTGSGLKKTGNIQLGKDGSGFAAMEIAAWWVCKAEPSATTRRLDAIYAHNYANVTI